MENASKKSYASINDQLYTRLHLTCDNQNMVNQYFFCFSAGHAMPIRSLTFSPDSQLLITASDDNHIKMYDVYHSWH